MKKAFGLLLLVILTGFLIPIFLTKPFQVLNQKNEDDDTKCIENYNYKELSKIKLLHTKTNEIEELNLDEYLYNVVSGEMPANYESEALKAQAVVARTYTIYQILFNTR